MVTVPIIGKWHKVVLISVFMSTVSGFGWQDTKPKEATSDSKQPQRSSRTGRFLEERQRKLSMVEPANRNKLVQLLATVENDGFDQIVTFQARHWRFGFGKISPVSGVTPAIQYERPRLGGSGIRLRAAGAYSLRNYQTYDFRLGWFDNPAPYKLSGSGFLGAPFDFDRRSQKRPRHFLYADIRYRNFPHEEFFGLGPDSLESNRTNYRYEDAAFDAAAGLQPFRWMGLGFRLGYLPTNVGPGQRDSIAPTETVFTPEEVPGLDQQADFLHLESALYMVSKGDPNRPTGELGVSLSRYNDIDENLFSFNRFSFDARGILPLGSRQRNLAARFFVSQDYADEGQRVPFYLMETLGGHNTLRGYRDFRFRDANILYMSVEYRWEAAAGIELAVFYDTGKVFPNRSDFTFKHLNHSYGIGFRGKTMQRMVFRMEVGWSEEGTRFYVSFGPAF